MRNQESKVNYHTGKTLSDGSEIMVGDKLKGSQSDEAVVLWDEFNQEYGVEILNKTKFWFTLDWFMASWGSTVIRTGNILERSK